MAAEIVNLSRARKAKARAAHDREAEASRRLHGMTKAERERLADERRRLGAHVEGHRREEGGEDEA
jgi:hypothetical protein